MNYTKQIFYHIIKNVRVILLKHFIQMKHLILCVVIEKKSILKCRIISRLNGLKQMNPIYRRKNN